MPAINRRVASAAPSDKKADFAQPVETVMRGFAGAPMVERGLPDASGQSVRLCILGEKVRREKMSGRVESGNDAGSLENTGLVTPIPAKLMSACGY